VDVCRSDQGPKNVTTARLWVPLSLKRTTSATSATRNDNTPLILSRLYYYSYQLGGRSAVRSILGMILEEILHITYDIFQGLLRPFVGHDVVMMMMMM
jgi:hypothetical protein